MDYVDVALAAPHQSMMQSKQSMQQKRACLAWSLLHPKLHPHEVIRNVTSPLLCMLHFRVLDYRRINECTSWQDVLITSPPDSNEGRHDCFLWIHSQRTVSHLISETYSTSATALPAERKQNTHTRTQGAPKGCRQGRQLAQLFRRHDSPQRSRADGTADDALLCVALCDYACTRST